MAMHIPGNAAAVEMNPQKEADLRAAFNLFDRNRDGVIDEKELGEMINTFGQKPTEKELKEMIREVDRTKAGKITFDQFVFMMAKRQQDPHSEGDAQRAFKLFDANNDGLISPAELKAGLAKFGENLTDKEVETIISEVDSDGDGQIHFQDFLKMLGMPPAK